MFILLRKAVLTLPETGRIYIFQIFFYIEASGRTYASVFASPCFFLFLLLNLKQFVLQPLFINRAIHKTYICDEASSSKDNF